MSLMKTLGKGDTNLYIDPIFPEGAFKTGWIAGDTSTRRPRFDYSEGKVVSVEEYSFGSVRICRKDTAYCYSFNSGSGGHKEAADTLNSSARLVRAKFDNSKTKVTFVPEIRDKITQGGGWR